MSLMERKEGIVTVEIDKRLRVILPHNISSIYKSIVESSEPLSSDSEYLQYLECFFIFTYEITQIKQGASSELLKDVNFDKVIDNCLSLIQELRKMKEILKSAASRRVSKCAVDVERAVKEGIPLAPRLVRLSKCLDLQPVEELAFGFVLISQAGSCFPFFEQLNVSTVSSMSLYCNMQPQTLLDFLSPHRKHIQNGLIEIDDQYKDCMSAYVLKMPKPCVHALVGSILSSDEFLKIDKTALASMLQKEPSFKLFNSQTGVLGGSNGEDEGEMDDEEDEEINAELAALEVSMGLKKPADNKSSTTKPKKKKKKSSSDGKEEEDETGEDGFDLYNFIDQNQKDLEDLKKTKKGGGAVTETVDDFLSPYKNNVEYLDDRFQLIATKIRIKNTELEKDEEKDFRTKSRSSDSILRELRAKERMLISKCEKRLEITRFLPRLELLAKKRGLCEFEKMILIGLVGSVISHEIQLASTTSYSIVKRELTVGYILWILCDNLEERIQHRVNFYRNSKLVSDGMITIQDRIRTDLMDLNVEIDRRMLDFIVGLDTEFSEIVEGSNLYDPSVNLDQVILPHEQKKLIVETVENFESFQKCRKRLGFDEVVTYGNSLVLLFYGDSGTGKTMTANALANHLGKKLLLINFSSLGDNSGEILRYIFRESKINDALLFFDECEAFFEKRKNMRSPVVPLLTELEKYDGLIVMATNQAHELDEAMHRRITLAIEFRPPDPILRERIWKNHFPKDIKIEENIDWARLSLNYELTGGLIKNAVLSALSFAIARDGGDDPHICEEDLVKGAKHQLRGIFTMNEFDRRIIPKHGLSDIILSKEVEQKIRRVIQFEKARKVLFSQWGFGKLMDSHRGTSILLFGPSGTGKSKACQAIAFEVGRALKCVDLGEILSKYVYNTTKNIEKLFQETRKTGAVLLIEITSITSAMVKNSMSQVLSNISNYNGIVIVCTSLKAMVTDIFTRSFKFVLEFQKPNAKLRLRIWEKLIPPEMPISNDVDLNKLARSYEFTGGNIENVLVRAASRTALEKIGKMEVNHKDLEEACREELSNAKFSSNSSSNMYQ